MKGRRGDFVLNVKFTTTIRINKRMAPISVIISKLGKCIIDGMGIENLLNENIGVDL